jgi:hypothetical protein
MSPRMSGTEDLPAVKSCLIGPMRTPNADSGVDRRAQAHPVWLTEELIEATLRVWQPYYDASLTRENAIDMILSADRLFSALSARP